jgi:arylsulfatase A-like enzyme
LRDPQRPWKKAAFTSQSARNHSLRTERWRYTEWGGPKNAELYDHETDPGELHNLANDPRHSKTVAELSQLLKDRWKAALPSG